MQCTWRQTTQLQKLQLAMNAQVLQDRREEARAIWARDQGSLRSESGVEWSDDLKGGTRKRVLWMTNLPSGLYWSFSCVLNTE